MKHELSRREMIGRTTGLGLGAASFLNAQTPGGSAPVPTWKTEMRQLAPNVFAYIQAGGPGMLNQGVSNGGVIVGDDHVLVND
jgi:hypothetical protein